MPVAVSPVQDQIDALTHDLHADAERGLALLRRTPEERLWTQPAPGRWSVGECFAHLNLTHAAMHEAMERSLVGERPDPPSRRYRLDFTGWLLVKFLEPGQKLKMKTNEGFVPRGGGPREALLNDFAARLEKIWSFARRGTEVDFSRLRMESPFRAGMRYSVYSGLRVTEAHLRRHMQQAEGVERIVGPEAPQS